MLPPAKTVFILSDVQFEHQPCKSCYWVLPWCSTG